MANDKKRGFADFSDAEVEGIARRGMHGYVNADGTRTKPERMAAVDSLGMAEDEQARRSAFRAINAHIKQVHGGK